jgi:hypothetical protein
MARPVKVQQLTFDAIGRICAETSSSEVPIPKEMEFPSDDMPIAERDKALRGVREQRSHLASKIHIAHSFNTVSSAYNDPKFRRRTAKKLKQAITKAKSLRRELEDLQRDELIVHGVNLTMRQGFMNLGIEGNFTYDDALADVRGLEKLLEATSGYMCGAEPPPRAGQGESSEPTRQEGWFRELAKIFQDCFGREAGISKTADGEPDGPFVRFAEAVQRELGTPMTRQAIAQAYRRSQRVTSA